MCLLSQTCSCSGLNADSSEKLLRSEIAGPGLATEKPWIPLLRISDATSNAALKPGGSLKLPTGTRFEQGCNVRADCSLSTLLRWGVPFSVPIALVKFPRLGGFGVSRLVALRTLRSVGAF